MASCFALTALNFKPIQTLSRPCPSSFSPPGHRQMAAGARVIRSEMRIYKGTQMREQRLTEMIEKKVMEAKQVCGEDDTSDECKVAWDEVEEVSQAKADLRLKLHHLHQDPLEHFCQDNPEIDECTVNED
ncbi:calvin cycle protein cp12-3 chloroplastic [Phtheirospermum japonicum]|uniref:Calvin cycle protein cp12-3 chloroplastic n=1 Tax=Phtheirospermum japonicum TaxID=374723 RepID=A0A830BU94_9LAMI|nr:calvin cycle protein cp12-3 chloroplastic [Phtheirospermum japonicum]